MHHDQANDLDIRQLYPHLSEAELAEANERLEQYLLLTMRVHDRIQSEVWEEHTNAVDGVPKPIKDE